jgi:hypothetical protein
MQTFISRMPVMRQFALLAVLGVALTVAGVGLSLKRSHDLAYDAKRAEIQHETEEGAAIVRYFLDAEKSGAMPRAEAQKRAIEAVGAIRFQGVNYVALLGFDGVSIANANKNIVGKNIIDLKDPTGAPVTGAQLAVAKSGKPGFAEFLWKKIGEDTPKLKMSYNIGIPEWQWDVTSGDFADDLDAALVESVVKLSAVFVPLLLGFLLVVFMMRRALARTLRSLSGPCASWRKGTSRRGSTVASGATRSAPWPTRSRCSRRMRSSCARRRLRPACCRVRPSRSAAARPPHRPKPRASRGMSSRPWLLASSACRGETSSSVSLSPSTRIMIS